MEKPATTKIEIALAFATHKREALLAKVKQMALDLAHTAKQLEASAEEADLARLVWTVRPYDAVLAAQIEAAHENLHFLTGLAAS
jgi:hypothetical protein